MSRVTPFVKRMRTNGGTIYTFNSAVEDIGLNINERNNVVKISNFALLNIPRIDYPEIQDQNGILENRFNLKAIPGSLEYWNYPGIKDGRVLIAESFQNYALNLEANLLDSSTYDQSLQKTVAERVFWKWLKETGAIRWSPDGSGNWIEETETQVDSSVGYQSVVKYVGQVTAGNVRSDSFGTYNETYILVPTSHGEVEAHFEQVEDTNYAHGMEIGNLTENILGREGYTKPHPDGLSYLGYYDFIEDPSTIVQNNYASPYPVYNLTYKYNINDPSSAWYPGSWFTAEGTTPMSAKNAYLIDTSAYITNGKYKTQLRYSEAPSGLDPIEFQRSNVDCIQLIWDLNKLKIIYNDPTLTFDKLAQQGPSGYSINDAFEFNAALIYYTIYNSVQDTVLAVNLLGILFLDAPSGNSANIGLGAGIIIPSLEKIQSNAAGFGTSYSLRLNIRTDNMTDDTQAIIYDESTSSQLYAEDWNEAFFQLGQAVNILTQNNSTINYISNQYNELANAQTQMGNSLTALQQQVNTISRDIIGTTGAIAMYTDGADPIGDSSIFQINGNIGMFTTNPTWPVQIDASLKTKDIYVENSVRDVSGNILIGQGSPFQMGGWVFEPSGNNLMLKFGTTTFTFTTDGSII
jgi:hypothetical protein